MPVSSVSCPLYTTYPWWRWGEHIGRGDPWTEPGEGKQKSEGTERLSEREDGDLAGGGGGLRKKNSEREKVEWKRGREEKRAVADGTNFAWALLPSAGHMEVVDRATPKWKFQNILAGRPGPYSSTWVLPPSLHPPYGLYASQAGLGLTPTPPLLTTGVCYHACPSQNILIHPWAEGWDSALFLRPVVTSQEFC
jgi:hypothetical protein